MKILNALIPTVVGAAVVVPPVVVAVTEPIQPQPEPVTDKYMTVSTKRSECIMTVTVIDQDWKDVYIPNLSASLDQGKTWQDITPVQEGETIKSEFIIPEESTAYIKGNNPEGFSKSDVDYAFFNFSYLTQIGGNVMGLLDNGQGTLREIPNDHCFTNLFADCSTINEISPNFLPATELKPYCYAFMFYNCTQLPAAPILPATNLSKARGCYSYMFISCVRLKEAPALPATALAPFCYNGMFAWCSKLEVAPELPALYMADSCYYFMFAHTAIKTLPKLPAETLAPFCYTTMFSWCNNLEEIEFTLPSRNISNSSYQGMFKQCEKLKTIKNPDTFFPSDVTLHSRSMNGMFSNCPRLHIPPKLPSRIPIYEESCFCGMFRDCPSLQYAPALPYGQEYAKSCCESMFEDCINLKNQSEDGSEIVLPDISLAPSCFESMFAGCSNQFTSTPLLNWENLTDRCFANMFDGCKKLAKVSVAFKNWELEDECTNDWLNDCATVGEFVYFTGLDVTVDRSASTIPNGWTLTEIK